MTTVGYDGNAPVFALARGSEIVDSRTGKVTRQGEDSPQNINIDRLEWLLAHRGIEKHQHEAGRRLQGDWEQSQLMGYAVMGGAGGGGSINRPSDAKCDALARYGAAISALVGPRHRAMIEMVVLQNVSLSRAAASIRLNRHASQAVFQDALDVLAAHYGLVSR